MRHLRLVGLALMAVFAFGVVVAGTAFAKEPSGFLFLPGQGGPVLLSGVSATAAPLLTVGTDKLECTKLEGFGEAGKEASEKEHATLGSATLDYTGCKESAKKAACRSENAKGEKDPLETILKPAAGTDVHAVSLENAEGKLVPGVLVGDLEVEKLDLTVNCGLVKILILGALFFEAKGANAVEGKDIESIEVVPNNTAKCDKEDTLCKKLLAAWGAVVGGKVCPLAGRLAETEFCASSSANPVKVEFSKDVLLDF